MHRQVGHGAILAPTITTYSSTSSAFLAPAKANEGWTKVSDPAECKRMQKCIQQRKYRLRMKERLKDLESRAASIATSSSTSSAFPASAEGKEDYTIIFDPAERRRIQNRIASRRYRERRKWRIEYLEQLLTSSSASPKHKPAMLQPPQPAPPHEFPSPSSSESPYTTPPAEDHMFTNQPAYQPAYQLPTSPSPCSVDYSSPYPALDTIDYFMPYSVSPCQTIPTTTLTTNMPSYDRLLPPYLPSYSDPLFGLTPAIKSEYYADEDMGLFTAGYASLGDIDIDILPPHMYPHLGGLFNCQLEYA